MGSCLGKSSNVKEGTKLPIEDKKLEATKGGSMVLPSGANENFMGNREALPSDVRAVAEFLDEAGQAFESENFNSPYYMQVDKKYKVGQKVVYPPAMDKNIVFNLKPKIEETPTSADAEEGSGGVQVTFAYKSLQGRTEGRAPDKPNQDSVAVVRNKTTPHRAIFGVFDGHGPFGEHASHFCRMEMLRMYSIAIKQHPEDSPEKIMGHTLRYLDRKFANIDHNTNPVDPIVSGTTAIVIMLDGEDIIAANIGDSRAILATRVSKDEVNIVPLSDDHKPERPDEKKRIDASSAILMNEREVRSRRSGGSVSEYSEDSNAPPPKTYICRATNGEIVYGVLFTRSIGDVDAHRHLGVSSEPEFRKEKVSHTVDSGTEQVIILGSDGVWDMMSNEECASIALTSMDPHVACDEIVRTAAERWATSGEGRRDDITACVVGLGIKFGWSKANAGGVDRAAVTESKDTAGGSYYGLI